MNGSSNTIGHQQHALSQQAPVVGNQNGLSNHSNTENKVLPANHTKTMSQSHLDAVNRIQELARLQIAASHIVNDVGKSSQMAHNGADDNVIGISSNGSSQEQTPMQLDSATTQNSGRGLETGLNGTRDSNSSSEESFDPYNASGYRTFDGTAEAKERPMLPVATGIPTNLPGLGSNRDQPSLPSSPRSDLHSTYQQKKTLAIQAVQDLASRKIGFDQISMEGIDSELLKGLYIESGVPMESLSAAPISKPALPKPAAQTEQSSSKSVQIHTNKTTHVQADPPTITAVPNFNLPLAIVAKPSISINTNKTSDDEPRGSVRPIKDTVDMQTPTTASSRQDYLAKLQAAKEAVKTKPVPPQPAVQVQDRSAYLAKLQAAKEAVKQGPIVKTAVTEAQPAVQSGNNTSVSMNTTPAARANIDALLRQKLEALRKAQTSSIVPRQQEIVAKDSSTPVDSQPSQNDRPTSSGLLSAVAKLRTPLRTFSADQAKSVDVPFFSPFLQKGFGGFPGLPGLPSMPSTPTVGQTDQINASASKEPEQAPAQRGLQDSQTVDHVNPDSILPISTKLAESNQQTLFELRSSRKRAVAADFIDPPPAKLQRGISTGPISLIIDVSEDEDNRPESIDDLIRNAAINERQGGADSRSPSGVSNRINSFHTPPQISMIDLQAKEDEIRELRQRILTATLRKSGKSGLETPTTVEPETSQVSDLEQAINLEDRQEQMKESARELTVQEKIIAAAKLRAQQHLERIRQNQAGLNAHAIKAQKEVDRAGTVVEREQRLKRKSELQAKLSSVEAIIAASEADLQSIKLQQNQLLAEIEQKTTARAALMDELTQLLETLEAEATVNGSPRSAKLEVVEAVPVLQPDSAQPAHEQTSSHPAVNDHSREAIPTTLQAHEEPIQLLLSNSNDSSRQASLQHNDASSSGEISDIEHDEDQLMEIDEDSTDDDDNDDDDEQEYDPEIIELSDSHTDHANHHSNEEVSDEEMDDYEPLQEVEILPGTSHTNQETDHQGLPTSYQLNTGSMQDSSAAVSNSSPGSNSMQQEQIEDISDMSDEYDGPESPSPESPALAMDDTFGTSSAFDAASHALIDTASGHGREPFAGQEQIQELEMGVLKQSGPEPTVEKVCYYPTNKMLLMTV